MKYIIASLFSVLLFVSIIEGAEIKKIVVPSPTKATSDLKKAANESPRQSRCQSEQFKCSNGQCINRRLKCNGQNDCIDGSDESFSTCFFPGGMTTSTTTPRYVEIHVGTEPGFSCKNGEFLCTSGECILQSRICNGRNDCHDGSDEGSSLCNLRGEEQRECSATAFRCNSGECIRMERRCDGSNDCLDSSDEDASLCGRVTDQQSVTTRSPREGVKPLENTTSTIGEQKLFPCNVPVQPANGHWKLHESQCNSGTECKPPANTRSLKPGTYLVYSCDQGFALSASKDVLCGPGGQWVHEPRCQQIKCPDLSSSSTEAFCTWHNVTVSCEVPAPVGTSAHLQCRDGFVQEVMYEQAYKNVICQPDGHWNLRPIECVKKPKKVKLLLTGDMIIED